MAFDISIVGYLAGLLSALSQFPQALKVIRTGDTQSISPAMYTILTLGVFFWWVYGILLNNLPMILSNGIALIPSFYILYITIRNHFRTKKRGV
ncbi:MAG: SemiSWEET family sugar transporter [Paludibacter sp.]